MTSRSIISTLGFLAFALIIILTPLGLTGCGGGGGGGSSGGGGGNAPTARPNVRLVRMTFNPANPVAGEDASATIEGEFTNIPPSTTITITVTRRENGAVTSLTVPLGQDNGAFGHNFLFVADINQSFYVAADTGNVLNESDEGDNNLENVQVPTVNRSGGGEAKNDFSIFPRGTLYIARLANVDRHFGLPINGNQLFVNFDEPESLRFGSAGMPLTIATDRSVEWAIDTRSLGNFRFGVKAKQASGAEMFLLPSTIEGNAYVRNVDGLSERQLAYRVISTATGRQVTTVPTTSVEIRPHAPGADPNGLQTGIEPLLTDLYVDPFAGVRGTLFVENITEAHMVATQQALGTNLVGQVKFDNPANDLFNTNASTTVPYDGTRDQLSVDLSPLSTATAHTLLISIRRPDSSVSLLNASSFGFKGTLADPIPTHSLIDTTTKLIKLQWSQTNRRWVSSRLG